MFKAFRVFLLCAVLVSIALPAEAWAIKRHDINDNVRQVQARLQELGYNVEVDGRFGEGTERTVKSFQANSGLEPDGVVGSATYAALFGEPMPASDPNMPAAVRNLPEISRGYGSRVQRVLEIAQQLYGVPYVWGGAGPGGFDCSGFVYYVFASAGVQLPRTADLQYEVGTPVPKDQLMPGDCVFFETYTSGPSHVGIYLADGKFIHAGSAEGSICLDTLNREYRIRTYLGARRMI